MNRRPVSGRSSSDRDRDRRSLSSSSRRSVTIKSGENDQNQPPVYVLPQTPLIISSEKQPRLTKLTDKPVYLYHAGGPTGSQPSHSTHHEQSNIYSSIPNSGANAPPGSVQYPLGHLNIPNNNTARIGRDSDGISNFSPLSDVRSLTSFSQSDLRSEKGDFSAPSMISNNDSVLDDQAKDVRRRRKSSRPWRGYVVEEEGTERIFQSVGGQGYYMKESISDGDTAVPIASATEHLLNLHIKFAAHRKFIDDGRSLESREVVDPAIPFNEPAPKDGQCECENPQKRIGIHHNRFPKEAIPRCDPLSNNANMLYHYRLIITPETNFVTRDPTTIYWDGKDFWFEGYSLFTHVLIGEIPPYTFTRNFIDYTVQFEKVDYIPEVFCIKDLDIVSDYFFNDIMELFDWERESHVRNCCRRFHFMPRFVHRTQDLTSDPPREVSEILSMGEVIQYLIESCTPFSDRDVIKHFNHEDWKDFAKEKHGSLATNLRNKPRTIRVDDVSHIGMSSQGKAYPDIVHLTPKFKEGTKLDMKEYGNLCAKLTKAKRAVKSRAIARREDQKLVWQLAEEIQKRKEIRGATKWVDINFTARKYLNTGLRWDVAQHASYLPALTNYLRFMLCLGVFERNMNYKFKDKSLLKVALTHPSHMDTASYSSFIWNMLQNTGKQFPHVEKRRKRGPPLIGAKKKGVIYMTNLMANLFQAEEVRSACRHNERLEFLGDAILDYLSSLHLFLMFPEKGPGKLTAFRSGIVQTENLADLSKKIGLDQFILVQHRVAELNKSESYLGNAMEAVVGAIFLDGGLDAVDNLLSFLLFIDDVHLCKVWNNPKKHPLQEEHPETDRHLVEKSDILKKFVHLENQIGVEFKHIRILAKAFTQSVHGLHDPKLTGGNYERLEFLGDAILKYVSSDYLYRHFPTHQEGHLTLLRSSLVNSRCLAQAARELGLNNFIIFQSYRESGHMKEKVCSDVFEALLGALHIEKGVEKGILYCEKLVQVCILSRLKEYIINQDWLDSKSQLQQCCHSLRDPANPLKDGKDYFHPVYKRLKYQAQGGIFFFRVAVYVNGKKLGVGEGRSTKEAEKEAAKQALLNNYFEQYAQQKRIIFRKFGARADKDDDDSEGSDEGEAVEIPKTRFCSDYEDDDDDEGFAEEDKEAEEDKPDTTALPPPSSTSPSKQSSVKDENDALFSIPRKSRESDRYSSRHRDSRHGHSTANDGRRSRESLRRKSKSKSKSPRRSRSRPSEDKSERKRSREKEQHSPDKKRSKRDENTSSRKAVVETREKPQIAISLDQWIMGQTNDGGQGTNAIQTSIPEGLALEAISSSETEDAENRYEPISSSGNDDNEGEYEVISSSEFESDGENRNATDRGVGDEEVVEKLTDEMEKELRGINSKEKEKEKEKKEVFISLDDELGEIDLPHIDFGDSIDLGDIMDDNFGDDELEAENGNGNDKEKITSSDENEADDINKLTDDERTESDDPESDNEFQEVDVWEYQSDTNDNTPTVGIDTQVITPDLEDDISLGTGDLDLNELEKDVAELEKKKKANLEQISDASLSEVEVY